MWFRRKKRIVVRPIVPGIRRLSRWRFRRRNATAATALETLLKEYGDGQQASTQDYPWCFALPAGVAGHTGPLIGAVQMHTGAVLYVSLPEPALEAFLQPTHSLAFWLAKALVARPITSTRRLRRTCRLIETHFCAASGSKQPPALMALLADCCEEGYAGSERCGVACMPWAAWPAVINNGGYLWLWKQNQHGRIVDSRRISLIHK